MPDLWVEIQAERDKLIEEAKAITKLQQAAERQEQLRRQEKIKRIKEKIHIYVSGCIGAIYVYGSIWFLTWLIEYDREWRWGY
jgi:hypothetical protein